MEELKSYKIHLWGYSEKDVSAPDPDNERKKIIVLHKGGFVGRLGHYLKKGTLEQAKGIARQLWKEWVDDYYSGGMIEVWIHEDQDPPRIGPKDALFHQHNFDKFRPAEEKGIEAMRKLKSK